MIEGSRAAAPRPWSLWALGAIFSSAFVCPPLCLIGPVLGVVALAETRRRGTRGRRVAVAAIALGVVCTAGWLTLMVIWNSAVRQPMLRGPHDALAAGFAGDIQGFQEAFVAGAKTGAESRAAAEEEPGSGATAADARAFLDALTDRYGVFVGIEPGEGPPIGPGEIDFAAPELPYRLRFESELVSAEAQFRTWSDGGLPMILRWGWIRVHDAARGDLSYPVAPDG